MNLSDLLRKIANSKPTMQVYIDTTYEVDCAYFEEEDYLTIEGYRHGKLTIFNIDMIDNVFDDGRIGVSGGDEMFIIEFVKN